MPTIVHFDIASDNPGRAKGFYGSLFGWIIESPPGLEDYYMIETTDLDGKPGLGGGLGKRGEPSQRITVYFGVDSVDNYSQRVKELGGAAQNARAGLGLAGGVPGHRGQRLRAVAGRQKRRLSAKRKESGRASALL
jgi:predicted enzyme related to lactoylglutathione lyase